MVDLMQYALIFYDFQLILAQMRVTVEGATETPRAGLRSAIGRGGKGLL